ncbi:unnamed protein product, partial [Brugia timori]|uniref:Uncharacterized protein n=1 Tax=Brugia timori TaxID=42155 RepID=A0A0R3QFR0_9BILA
MEHSLACGTKATILKNRRRNQFCLGDGPSTEIVCQLLQSLSQPAFLDC